MGVIKNRSKFDRILFGIAGVVMNNFHNGGSSIVHIQYFFSGNSKVATSGQEFQEISQFLMTSR